MIALATYDHSWRCVGKLQASISLVTSSCISSPQFNSIKAIAWLTPQLQRVEKGLAGGTHAKKHYVTLFVVSIED
jgi:hypothetical protein